MENVIDVSSQGSIGRVIVGVPCTKTESNNCRTAFLSANNVTLPVTSTYDPGGITINLHSSQVSDVAGLSVKSAGFFIPKVSGYLLKWVWLRIDGTGTCNRYLIRYSNDSEPHNDECVAPQDLENC